MRKSSILLLWLVIACQQHDWITTPASNRLTQTADGLSLSPEGHAHLFPRDSAMLLMAHLTDVPQLQQITSSMGWGSEFPQSAFRVTAGNQGVMLWYCVTPGPHHLLFLALEQVPGYDPAALPQLPTQSYLLVPDSVFTNVLAPQSSVSQVSQFLASQSNATPGWSMVARTQIVEYIQRMDSLLLANPDSSGERLNAYPFAYFSASHESSYDAFLDRSGRDGLIRYVFGYEAGDHPNRIRVILFPASTNGVNLRLADDNNTLQHSWPPPPQN